MATTSLTAQSNMILWAKLQAPAVIQVMFAENSRPVKDAELRISPAMEIKGIRREGYLMTIETGTPFALDHHYYIQIGDDKPHFLQPDGILDSLYSHKPLGARHEGDNLVFRLFAPRAKWVRLVRFEYHDQLPIEEHAMIRDRDGVWELNGNLSWAGGYYGYRLDGPHGNGEMFDPAIVLADPYSEAVATRNHYTHPGRTLILAKDSFDWEGDSAPAHDPRDLLIYEAHVRDMSMHPSSAVPANQRGTYSALASENQSGGLPYLRDLGINALELLPVQDFGNMEITFRDSSASVFNNWNPYERNHWGYMTSYFFAPESYYAAGGTMQPDAWNGQDGRQVSELKEMVKSFHKSGIAVIMDVVYNHVSQYDYNPLKYIDKFYYFRLRPDGNFETRSGCGNDLKTERPMARRLILDSVRHWMEHYHVDGFRFDLAYLIDPETCRQILKMARGINPDVIIIAEPWGGGYDPAGFSDIGWASWNDKLRNGYKGWNAENDRGFIFGDFQGENTPESLRSYLMGSLRSLGAQYHSVTHSVNYLASHDDHTLGDFIRIGSGEVDAHGVISDRDAVVRLSARQLQLSKLAAMMLFVSQGPLMLHAGQEFARSKIIAPTNADDPKTGQIDHNSYEKDNETNWLNYNDIRLNEELFNFYKALIKFRKAYPAFRHASPSNFEFLSDETDAAIAFSLNFENQQFYIYLNGRADLPFEITAPPGSLRVIADMSGVYPDRDKPRRFRKRKIVLPPTSGLILQKMDTHQNDAKN